MEIKQTEVLKTLMEKPLKRFNLLRGGTRSGKSYALIQLAAMWLMSGKINNHNIPTGQMDIVRDTFPALRQTMLKDFDEYLHELGVYGYVDHSKTQHLYRFNGREVLFYPLTDEQRLKGKKRDLLIINEADGATWYQFQQLNYRTTKWLWLDYNPNNSDSWVKENLEEGAAYQDDINLMISTFRMNPFLDPAQVKEIERLREVDRELFEIYNLGNWVKLTGLIYPKTTHVPSMPDGKRVYGLDFGFSNDPTALVEIVKIDKNLYFKELIYEKELLTKDVIKFLQENVKRTDPIIADSADPKAIEEIRRAGFKIKPSKKGADSVRKGIDTVKTFNLFYTEDSVNLETEFRRYKWKKDKEDKTLNVPIDSYNHCMDALRYGVEYIARRSKFKVL